MGGDLPETVFRWRAEIASGRRLGPRILSSGPKLDSTKPLWPGSLRVTGPETARAAVDKVKGMGADFVKIYARDFPPDVFAAIIDEAHKQGLEVGGHLPFMTMTTREDINGGIRFIEHSDMYVLGGCSLSEKQINDEYVARSKSSNQMHLDDLLYRYALTYEETWARKLATELNQHHVWLTSTLGEILREESLGKVNYEQHPERKYVFPGMWQT
jgi:hypothetical protein